VDPEASLRRFFDLINSGDLDGFLELFAQDYVEHEAVGDLPPTREGTKQLFMMMRTGFPDMNWEPEDIIADREKAVARVRFTGTNDGEFMGMPATGKSVSVQVIDIVRFGDDGLAREHWGIFDQMSMLAQLGAVPGQPA
jgi:steroid delta-isomerase-like uncharacterized protein